MAETCFCGAEYVTDAEGKTKCKNGHEKKQTGRQYADYPFRDSPWGDLRKKSSY